MAFSSWLGSRDSTCPTTLRRLVSQATIYMIWRERNNRLHNNISAMPHTIYKTIDRLTRYAILGKKKSKRFSDLMQTWLAFD
ncbi:unnamed protein product [Thlaspi arvense]|uniref:Uncharacterized protein n=1 Tax=Thlaspi arvense TaxID=13288 RepID=A0AAU9SKT1_THLAR|nr:unnamed protein product [Thlaspi arvense]